LNTTIKLIPLGVLILGGLFFIEPSHYAGILSIPPLGNIGEASLILFFAFQGSESALNIGGEMKNPSKTAPKGILIGVGMIVLIYISIQLVVQGLLGSDLSAYEKQPLAYAAERFMGHSGFLLLSIAAVWSIFSNLGSSPLLFPRIIYATAVHKDLPSALAKVHLRYQTPYIAIAFYGILAFLLAISGGFRQLAVISSAAILLMYLTVTLACMKNIWQKKFSEFKMPLGMLTPTIALIIILYFLSNLNQNEMMYTAIFILASSMIYLAIHILDKKK
jgi:amino acid transporter